VALSRGGKGRVPVVGSLLYFTISRGDEMNLFRRNGMLDWQCLEMAKD
jgi:hypothetical protein